MKLFFVLLICTLLSSCSDANYNNKGYVISKSAVEEGEESPPN